MSNILDYIKWRGDLPFDRIGPNEVDGLILAETAMFSWERFPENAGSLREAAEGFEGPVSDGFTAENDAKALRLLCESERFGGMRVCDYVNEFDEAADLQFSAVTLRMADGSAYVAFRGTDGTIVGWKEDCCLAFSKPVAAQEAARKYLERAAEACAGPILTGGHSKGGNLAMYAAACQTDAVLRRIRAVYNYDGPGLSDRMDAPAMYRRIADRLKTFVPQGSVVGMLLAHPQEYGIVRSNSISVLQHDPYSWQVEGPRFVRMPKLSQDSVRFDAAFHRWLSGMEENERAELVGTLFEIIRATGAQSFGREFWAGLAVNGIAVVKAIQGVEPERRARVSKMISELVRLAVTSGG